ncbi:DUF2147 domain-containing protein [Pelagibacterium luteolum]|uniref:Uncharacterized conserved protein, DUF2147 family n=1 Tax=Pelagibacterium luteolum TaxID=440168 RepID=A0A1G7VXG4_9HYPH|nr:DUF2147 domain-containing protein [Pelagibacterium luteolum]SDG64413.1 Uncharacterized conserved protein, DUF2147 family [Pelagibacterium luteolum]
MIFFGRRLGAALLVVAGLATPLSASAPTPVGDWQISTGESRFEITNCGDGTLCAKLTWLDAEASQDETLASYLGDYVMEGATPAAANTWTGAVNYDGDVFSGKLTMVDEDTLSIQGCKAIFCKSMELERI